MGAADKVAFKTWKGLGSTAATLAKTHKAASAAVALVGAPTIDVLVDEAASEALSLGLLLATFDDTRFKTKQKGSKLAKVEVRHRGVGCCVSAPGARVCDGGNVRAPIRPTRKYPSPDPVRSLAVNPPTRQLTEPPGDPPHCAPILIVLTCNFPVSHVRCCRCPWRAVLWPAPRPSLRA
jgi:hypothetical protein